MKNIFTETDKQYMSKAYKLANKFYGRTMPNPPVGAVIVKNNRIVGMGAHQKTGENHAEINALQSLKTSAKGSILYVTLEPCNHYGKTPPCTKAIINAQIKKVVFANKDPYWQMISKAKQIDHPGGYSQDSGENVLKKYGIEVQTGLMKKKCKNLLRIYYQNLVKKCFIGLKAATTLDGKIALANGNSKWISNEQSRNYVQKIRKKYQAIIVGRNTLLNDNPRLNVRLKTCRQPLRIIISNSLEWENDLIFFKQAGSEKFGNRMIITGMGLSDERKKIFEKKNISIREINTNNHLLRSQQIKESLYDNGIYTALLEGGSILYSSFLKDNGVDYFHLFMAPVIFADNNSIPVFQGFSLTNMQEAKYMKIVRQRQFRQNIYLEAVLADK